MLFFPAVLPSAQSHTCLCSFSTRAHTHTVTPAYAHTQDIHRHIPLPPLPRHCWWLQLVGSALALLFWSEQGLSYLCVCAAVCLSALYSYAYAGVWATLVIVWFLVCICVGRCDFCACELWMGASVAPYSFNTRFWRSFLSPLQISLLQCPSM